MRSLNGFTTSKPKNALKNMLNRGLKQSDNVIIENVALNDRYIKRTVLARIKAGQLINEVWIKTNKKLRLIYKNTKAQ